MIRDYMKSFFNTRMINQIFFPHSQQAQKIYLLFIIISLFLLLYFETIFYISCNYMFNKNMMSNYLMKLIKKYNLFRD